MTTVYLHVGAPKSGTTYLQDILFHHRDAMATDGVLYPAERFDEHFFAAVDLQQLAFYGAARPEGEGFWSRVANRAREFDGTVVISHDVFVRASAEQARGAVEALQPADVHIVYTARDLVRQAPSQWHETVKNGRQVRLEDYLDELTQPDVQSEASTWFWHAHDPVDVLARWGAAVPPEFVHVVTVPRPEAPPTLLWERFASLVGLDPSRYDVSGISRGNRGLGVPETELLRRTNIALDGRMGQINYEHVTKGLLANRILDERPATSRLLLPPKHHAWFAERSTEQVALLREAGYHVVGDLAELLPDPVPSSEAFQHPDEATDADVATAGVHATAELLLELERYWERARRDAEDRRDLQQRLDAAESALREQAELPDLERIKRAVVEVGNRNPAVARALRTYRRVRTLVRG